jgi:hypothetical protein
LLLAYLCAFLNDLLIYNNMVMIEMHKIKRKLRAIWIKLKSTGLPKDIKLFLIYVMLGTIILIMGILYSLLLEIIGK